MKSFKKFVEEKKITEGVMTFKISTKKNSYGDTVYYVSQIKLDDGSVWNNYPRLLFGPDNTYDDKSGAKRAIDRYMNGRGEYKIIGEDAKVVLHTKNGKVDWIKVDDKVHLPIEPEFAKKYNVDVHPVMHKDVKSAKDYLIKHDGYKPEDIIVENYKICEGNSITQYSYGSKYKMVPFENLKRGDMIFSYNDHNKHVDCRPFLVKNISSDRLYAEAVDGPNSGTMYISKTSDPMVPAIQNRSDAQKAADEYMEDIYGE